MRMELCCRRGSPYRNCALQWRNTTTAKFWPGRERQPEEYTRRQSIVQVPTSASISQSQPEERDQGSPSMHSPYRTHIGQGIVESSSERASRVSSRGTH